MPMTRNSTPLTSMTATGSPDSSAITPQPSTIALIKQFARVYVPALGGIILN